ncbi:peptidylprolyl isomerase [Geothrix alkalitolerans]|uniref:peptidylprolyl isomerase n=1 Tax=Geothrix alkalitolerans TaxID=2922724 RepID=UPI001FAFC9A8|nr:peptidylprolyl isomerase [Geothrix alkalitolerans]
MPLALPLPRLAVGLLAVSPLFAQGPRFTVRDAIRAEWARQPLAFADAQRGTLAPQDRARLDRTIRRIGAPGSPALLPPELDNPSEAVWLAKAAEARTPRERFDALFFLNRFKSPKALMALDGLVAEDAATWPGHLHLEASLATARLNGAEISPGLRAFLDALQKAGKVDPVRAQAARLRLVMAGKEKELLPPVPATPGSILALMDAWNRAPWPQRRDLAMTAFASLSPESPAWARLGLARPDQATLDVACVGILSRLAEGVPRPAPAEAFNAEGGPWPCAAHPLAQWYGFQALAKLDSPLPGLRTLLDQEAPFGATTPLMMGTLLPALRIQNPVRADLVRARLLAGSDGTARAAGIEDLPSAPTDLEALTRRVWSDTQFEPQQTLIQSYGRWKLPLEEQKARLRPWLQHPNWTCRWEAYQALVKLDPATPWPRAPKPTSNDTAILREAIRLAERGKPLRLRISLSGKRSITLRLDPAVAPMNITNLVLLARKGYFKGRLVPRVVPDFVVQMGSPFDTMDGGPGYTVRCEDSLDWYGPGSVGMALAGKDTGGSQFFITTNATPHLTGKYTRMGEVEDLDAAMKILDDLELGARILSVRVLEP